MKKIMLITSASLLFFAGSQVCGGACPANSGRSCSVANAQTIETTVTKGQPKTVTLKITGMTCAGCANHVSTALGKVDGIIEEEVKYPGDIAVVKYDPEKTSVKEIITAIEKTGYKAAVQTDGKGDKKSEKSSKTKKSCAPGC